MVTAVRISNSSATVGVAIIGKPNPVVPLTNAAISKEMPTKIVVKSKNIVDENRTNTCIEKDSLSLQKVSLSIVCDGLFVKLHG
jgi:hypothetical protein